MNDTDFRIFNTPAERAQGISIAVSYNQGVVKGWDAELGEEAFNVVGNDASIKIYKSLPPQMVANAAGKKTFLYQVNRKVLGQDTKNYPQQIGDCVSFGAKNAIEYLICCEKLLKGERAKWRPIFPPYLYGTGRVYVGNGRLGSGDGSLGSWMAEAVIKYGTIPSDEEGVPNYQGSVAKQWGAPNGRSYLDKWKGLGQKHLVRSAAKINNWEELVAAVSNGYPCTVASNQGFTMEADSRGFHRASGSWAHQMCIIGIDDEYSDPYALILNSWGDVHGHLKSFYDPNENLPVGVIRAHRTTIENMIRSGGETFAYGNMDDFEDQDLNEALFKIVGR
jgi:hypothetical protein